MAINSNYQKWHHVQTNTQDQSQNGLNQYIDEYIQKHVE